MEMDKLIKEISTIINEEDASMMPSPETNLVVGGESMPRDQISSDERGLQAPSATLSEGEAPKVPSSRSALASGGESMSRKPNRNPKPHLTGAAKRRLRKWIAEGKSYEEALKLCRMPYDRLAENPESDESTQRPTKRSRSEDESPRTQPNKKLAKSGDHLPPTYSDMAKSYKLGIMDVKKKPLCESDADLIKAAILSEVLKAGPNQGPSFYGCILRAGCVVLTCADDTSRLWLTENVGNIKPWEGACLRLIDERDLPKPKIGIAWIPGPVMESRELLRLLTVQNRDLNCTGWRVLNQKIVEGGQTVTFSFDEESFSALQKIKFRPFLGFGCISVRMIANKTSPSNRENISAEAPSTAEPLPGPSCSGEVAPDAPVASVVAVAGPAGAAKAPLASQIRGSLQTAVTATGSGGQSAQRPPTKGAKKNQGATRSSGRGGRRPVQLPSLAKEHSSKKASRNPLLQ